MDLSRAYHLRKPLVCCFEVTLSVLCGVTHFKCRLVCNGLGPWDFLPRACEFGSWPLLSCDNSGQFTHTHAHTKCASVTKLQKSVPAKGQ